MLTYCLTTIGRRRYVNVVSNSGGVLSDGELLLSDERVPDWLRELPDGCYDGDTREPLPVGREAQRAS